MSTSRLPADALVPMATRYFANRRREELPGWRSPSDSRSPGLSLSVRRPYYVTDRGLYNSQPRYPRSRGIRVSMPVLPQIRGRPGALLRVQLRNRRLDLDVEGEDTDRGWEAYSRRSVDNSESHHRHPSGQMELIVGNGNRLNLGPLWASSTLQRITRSRSTEEIESVRCQFPRPQAARSQSEWEPEALQERKLLRRLRLRRFAPEILFQAPPPRVRRKRPAASSLSTALGEVQHKSESRAGSQSSRDEADSGEYEGSEEYEDSSGVESKERGHEDASQNCSSPFSSTSSEAPVKIESRRIASRRDEKRPVSEIEARRVASEKVTTRWPAGLLESAATKPKRLKKAANPVSESAPAEEKKPRKRKQKHSVVTVLQQGEVIDPPQDIPADTSVPSVAEKLLSVSQSEINASRPPEGDDTMATLAFGGDKQTTFDSAPQTMREVETRVPSAQGATRTSEEPSNTDMRKPRPKKREQVDLGYPAPFSDVELSSESSDGPRQPETHTQILDLSDPPKRRRKRSFTSIEARLKSTDIQNLSFHSSSAIEERPDTEELSEFSRPSIREAPARVNRQGVRTFTRRPNRTLSTGKESVTSGRTFTPAVEQKRPGSHQSPGLQMSRGFSRDQQMSADDWTLASTLRMPIRAAEVSGKGGDTNRSSKSVKKADSLRPATSQKVAKPRQSLHPMSQATEEEKAGLEVKDQAGNERRLQRRQNSKEPIRDTPTLTKPQSSERLVDTPQSAEKQLLSEKSQSSDQVRISEKPNSSEKSDLNEKLLNASKSPSPEKAETPGQSESMARKSEDEGIHTPLDELVLNISASVLSIVNQLLLSDPERLRARLLPVLESITIKPAARKEKEEEEEEKELEESPDALPHNAPQPVRSSTIPKAIVPVTDSIPKSQSLTKVETIKRKLADTKVTAPKKQPKKPLSLTTRVAMITAKDAVKKIAPKPKVRKPRAREQFSSSSSPESSFEDVEEAKPRMQSQFRMVQYETRQMSFIQKLAENLLKGSNEADPEEPQQPEFPDSDDEEFIGMIHNKGFDVHRRMQSMFELMRFPVQNAFTVEIDKELKPRPPPSRETVLPQETVVDRKNREDARLIQKFKMRLDTLATHDTLAQQQEGTLFQSDHRRLDPREIREYYVRLGRLKRHDAAARRGVKLNAQAEYTFSQLEMRYYLNEFAKLHPRKRAVLPPIRSRLEDLYEERIYGRLKNDPDEKLFPSHPHWRLDSLEASLEELEHVSQHNSTHRSSL